MSSKPCCNLDSQLVLVRNEERPEGTLARLALGVAAGACCAGSAAEQREQVAAPGWMGRPHCGHVRNRDIPTIYHARNLGTSRHAANFQGLHCIAQNLNNLHKLGIVDGVAGCHTRPVLQLGYGFDTPKLASVNQPSLPHYP